MHSNNIVVFASGSGTNFQSIIDAVESGYIPANIAGLIASKPDIGALDRAKKSGIPHCVINPADFSDSDTFGRALLDQLNSWNPALIVLAGFMKKIPENVIQSYPDSIINIHPSLLPRYGGKGFYGKRVHEAVLESGDSESGCTVHLVNAMYDQGEILAQKKVPVRAGDTPESLAQRVLSEEHKLLPNVIRNLLTTKKS